MKSSGGTAVRRSAAASRPLWRRGAAIGAAWALALPAFLITAQAADASWLQQTTPPVSGATSWDFSGVSCVSPNVCMAVGQAVNPSGMPLAELKNRGAWTLLTVPDPGAGSAFESVSCTSVKFCEAVGTVPSGGGNAPLAEFWNGASWQIQTAITPPGAIDSELDSVSCTSAKACTAAGEKTASSARTVPLAERWNGVKWRIQSTPSPAKALSVGFTSVSCTAAKRCVAVGDSSKGSQDSALAELWNGAKWTTQKTPDLPSGNDSQLNSVSCTSASACMAGGTGMAERWNGKKWTLQKIANPHGGTPTTLFGISCVRAGVCYGVGSFFADGVETRTAQFWNGSTWSNEAVPITTSQDSSELSRVSCTTAQDCTAVGSYHDPVDGTRALAEDFELRWQDQSPLPLNGVTATSLDGVSCSGARACVAVGSFEESGVFVTFTEFWDGSGWFLRLPPEPKISDLAAISCTGPSSCLAVGDILGSSSLLPLAVRWNGIRWSRQRVPLPAGADKAFLNAVSCTSPDACTAVGMSSGKAGKQVILAERWTGKSWSVQHTPGPAGTDATLRFVSCGSATACVAAGSSSAGRLLEMWDGKTWKIRTAPLPGGSSSGFLNGVSCTSATACTLVGDYRTKTRLIPFADRWNGKSWKPQAVPARPTGSSGFNGISCVSAASCTAIGFTVGGATTFGQHWNGRRWSVPQPMQLPVGGMSMALSSLSCTSATACMSTGFYVDSTSTEQMLAEQFS